MKSLGGMKSATGSSDGTMSVGKWWHEADSNGLLKRKKGERFTSRYLPCHIAPAIARALMLFLKSKRFFVFDVHIFSCAPHGQEADHANHSYNDGDFDFRCHVIASVS